MKLSHNCDQFYFFTLRLKLAYIHYTLCSPQTLTVMRLQLPELSQHQETIIKGAGQAVTLDAQAREHRLFN